MWKCMNLIMPTDRIRFFALWFHFLCLSVWVGMHCRKVVLSFCAVVCFGSCSAPDPVLSRRWSRTDLEIRFPFGLESRLDCQNRFYHFSGFHIQYSPKSFCCGLIHWSYSSSARSEGWILWYNFWFSMVSLYNCLYRIDCSASSFSTRRSPPQNFLDFCQKFRSLTSLNMVWRRDKDQCVRVVDMCFFMEYFLRYGSKSNLSLDLLHYATIFAQVLALSWPSSGRSTSLAWQSSPLF